MIGIYKIISPSNKIYVGSSENLMGNKPINQFDLNMNSIRSFNSIRGAAKELSIDYGTLVACLKGRQKTCKGFKWKYI